MNLEFIFGEILNQKIMTTSIETTYKAELESKSQLPQGMIKGLTYSYRPFLDDLYKFFRLPYAEVHILRIGRESNVGHGNSSFLLVDPKTKKLSYVHPYIIHNQ